MKTSSAPENGQNLYAEKWAVRWTPFSEEFSNRTIPAFRKCRIFTAKTWEWWLVNEGKKKWCSNALHKSKRILRTKEFMMFVTMTRRKKEAVSSVTFYSNSSKFNFQFSPTQTSWLQAIEFSLFLVSERIDERMASNGLDFWQNTFWTNVNEKTVTGDISGLSGEDGVSARNHAEMP